MRILRQRPRAERDEQEWKQGITVHGVRDGQGVLSKAAQSQEKGTLEAPAFTISEIIFEGAHSVEW